MSIWSAFISLKLQSKLLQVIKSITLVGGIVDL